MKSAETLGAGAFRDNGRGVAIDGDLKGLGFAFGDQADRTLS